MDNFCFKTGSPICHCNDPVPVNDGEETNKAWFGILQFFQKVKLMGPTGGPVSKDTPGFHVLRYEHAG